MGVSKHTVPRKDTKWQPWNYGLVQNADVSIYNLKCHKMLSMSHFDKTVMNIGYYHHQGSTNRHMDQESKYCGNKRQLNVV